MHKTDRAAPPAPQCLYRPYSSRQKGGTLIAAAVQDLATHLERVRSPDGYRPATCPTCGHEVMHAHDRRTRQCQLAGAPPQVPIVRHRCAHPDCGAQWQTLPAFLARHLHFVWSHVEQACEGHVPTGRRPSRRTTRRWLGRLASSAAQLVRLACDAGGEAAATLRTAFVDTRGELVDTLALPFAEVAAWVHQLQRGVRLM
jgi:hypothetical protein